MIGEKHGKNYSDENDMQEMRLEKFSIFSILQLEIQNESFIISDCIFD